MFLIDGIRIPIIFIVGGAMLFVTCYLGMHFTQLNVENLPEPIFLPKDTSPFIISAIFQWLCAILAIFGASIFCVGILMLGSYYHRGRRPHFVIVFPFNKNTSESLKEIARRYIKDIDCQDYVNP